MIRGSTTNIYKEDKDSEYIMHFKSIQNVITEIDKRLIEDNATSGFEKLYTKLVKEYFGGMHRVFQEVYKILKPGGKFILLVSDSHAFKMVHIHTADILIDIAEDMGYVNCQKELWQFKKSTSHSYNFFEDIVTIQKPLLLD
jgi:DNA modification methylase